jgi:dihydrolipoamide dehydrogenase
MQDGIIKCDTAVLGAGPGGYIAALRCAEYGQKVVLAEKAHLGGTCLNWGCIPTKCLSHSAEFFAQMRDCAVLGLEADNPRFSLPEIMARKNNVIERLRKGIAFLLRKAEVQVVQGRGEVAAPGKIRMEEDSLIQSQNIILATGSKTWTPDLPGRDLPGVLTSRQALDLQEPPASMAILGGGVIGMEFAFILASLGTKVTVIEFLPSILPGMDKDAVREIMRSAKKAGIDIRTSSRGERIEADADGLVLFFSREETIQEVRAEKILLAVGRKPNMDGINAHALGLDTDPRTGGIIVDKRMRTSVPGIHAVGDLTNIMQLAHVASAQGETAAADIAGHAEEMDYSAVPACIFTLPEAAFVGLSEEQAREKGQDILVGKASFMANGRAQTMGETAGLVKVVAQAGTGLILGVSIVGPRATDLIAEAALALQNNLHLADIHHTIHAHPTLAETLHEAVADCMTKEKQ